MDVVEEANARSFALIAGIVDLAKDYHFVDHQTVDVELADASIAQVGLRPPSLLGHAPLTYALATALVRTPMDEMRTTRRHAELRTRPKDERARVSDARRAPESKKGRRGQVTQAANIRGRPVGSSPMVRA
jgi:hypothetical protein